MGHRSVPARVDGEAELSRRRAVPVPFHFEREDTTIPGLLEFTLSLLEERGFL